MQKQAPTLGRLATMVLFALSCFGLLTFLWLAFGGAIPMKPTGYQVRVAFDEATQLASQSDVVIAGIPVGKVARVEPAPNATIATLNIERRYAPLRRDTRATLRDKTLLGQTYVELTPGSRAATTIPERGLLDQRNVKPTTQLDELLNTLDPYTRKAYGTWQQGMAEAVTDRGDDLNSAIGNLPEFVVAGGDLFAVLDTQKQALGALVRNSGVVFGALSEREDQLRALIENSDTVFTAIQRQREDFAETWNVLPTFLTESRATYRRLERFARETRPLVRDLEPAMRDLRPTLLALRDLSPDLRRLFVNLDPLIDATRESLPAQAEVFQGLRPLLGALGPWLSEVNPTLDWLGQHSHTVSDIFANLGVATQAKTGSRDPLATGHYLRQFSVAGAETLAIHPNRLAANRGNAYINPLSLIGPDQSDRGIIAAFDCKNVSGDADKRSNEDSPACFNQKPFQFQGKLQKFPQIAGEDYTQPAG
jgi:phospholipid/cholesterol/gamma-HCH transport system substrate-binding protein